METKHHHLIADGLRLGFDIAKLTLKAAALVAAFLTVRELHKVHQSLEARHRLSK